MATNLKSALAALGISAAPLLVLHLVDIGSPSLRIHLCYWTPLVVAVVGAWGLGLWRGQPQAARGRIAMIAAAVAALFCFVLPAPVAFGLKWVSFTYGNHLQFFNNLVLMTAVMMPLTVVCCLYGWGPLVYGGVGGAGRAGAAAVLPGIVWISLFLVTPWQFEEWPVVVAFLVYALGLELACFLLYRAGARWQSALLRGIVIYTNVYILGDGSTDLYPATMYTASEDRFYWFLAIAALTGAALCGTVMLLSGKRTGEPDP